MSKEPEERINFIAVLLPSHSVNSPVCERYYSTDWTRQASFAGSWLQSLIPNASQSDIPDPPRMTVGVGERFS
jgi:hypothetical protein